MTDTHIELTFIGTEQSLQLLLSRIDDLPFDCFLDEGVKLVTSLERENWTSEIQNQLRVISQELNVDMQQRSIADQNWNLVWESNFQPITIDSFVHVRADFHPPNEGCQYELVITPQMAFGTGHHQTTRLMISAMRNLNMMDKKVLDFGAGTGILGILAAQMGASQVCCVENDQYAFDNLKQNILLNQVSHTVLALCNEKPIDLPAPVDVMLVNITRNVIIENLERLTDLLETNSEIILSGFHNTDEEVILSYATELGLTHILSDYEDSWTVLILSK